VKIDKLVLRVAKYLAVWKEYSFVEKKNANVTIRK
jgi:hypothetical protein